tara:strand:- start:331 stop:570 length:240 start_codon:yes stop_codon:yes gene_type:complete
MTEKPDQEFDPSNIPSFDPIQELKEKGQFHIKSDGTASMGKKETPAEKIEREERDALFYEAIKKMRMEEEEELNKKERY